MQPRVIREFSVLFFFFAPKSYRTLFFGTHCIVYIFTKFSVPDQFPLYPPDLESSNYPTLPLNNPLTFTQSNIMTNPSASPANHSFNHSTSVTPSTASTFHPDTSTSNLDSDTGQSTALLPSRPSSTTLMPAPRSRAGSRAGSVVGSVHMEEDKVRNSWNTFKFTFADENFS